MQPNPRVCNFWANGSCKFGMNCKFYHPNDNKSQQNSQQLLDFNGSHNKVIRGEKVETKIIKIEHEVKGKDFIFLVDSSGSMLWEKFETLKDALYNAIREVGKANSNNRVSVINFSSKAEKVSSYHQKPESLLKNLDLKPIGWN